MLASIAKIGRAAALHQDSAVLFFSRAATTRAAAVSHLSHSMNGCCVCEKSPASTGHAASSSQTQLPLPRMHLPKSLTLPSLVTSEKRNQLGRDYSLLTAYRCYSAPAEQGNSEGSRAGSDVDDESASDPPENSKILVKRTEQGVIFYLPSQGFVGEAYRGMFIGSFIILSNALWMTWLLAHNYLLLAGGSFPVMYLGYLQISQATIIAYLEEQFDMDVENDRFTLRKVMQTPWGTPKIMSQSAGRLSALGRSAVVCPVERPKGALVHTQFNAVHLSDGGDKDMYMGVFMSGPEQVWLSSQVNKVLETLGSKSSGGVWEKEKRHGRWIRHLKKALAAQLAASAPAPPSPLEAAQHWQQLAAPPKPERTEIGSGRVVSK